VVKWAVVTTPDGRRAHGATVSTIPSNDVPRPAPATRRGGRARLRALRWLSPLVILGVPAVIATRAFVAEYRSFVVAPSHPDLAEARRHLPGLQQVALGNASGPSDGWYAPGTLPAAVLLVHGAYGDRSSMLDEAKLLADAGFGVLSIDLPGHGARGGMMPFEGQADTALDTAVTWLQSQGATSPRGLGAVGYSLGGYFLAQHASRDPRLRGVVLGSTMPSLDAFLRHEYRRWGALGYWPAYWADRARGLDVRHTSLLGAVAALSPRPVLFVVGQQDGVVPPSMTQPLIDAARPPKEVLVLEHSGHVDFAQTDPSHYGPALVGFMRRALLSTPSDNAEQSSSLPQRAIVAPQPSPSETQP